MREVPGVVVLSAFFGSLCMVTCSNRSAEVEMDYTEEVEVICTDLCEKVVTCADPPLFETQEECWGLCTRPEQPMYEDSRCGEAFRNLYGCVGGTNSCEEYLDTNNIYAEDYMCKAEGEAITSVTCTLEGDD